MIVSDVMTRNVLAVKPDETVEQAANLMLRHGISGLFVVDAKGVLVGVVTEGDLLRRDEIGTQRHRPWWLRVLVSPGRQALDFTHAHGRRVSDVMTPDVITVGADAPLKEVVETMEKHRIKRVAVIENGHMTGVVARSDLLRALLSHVRDAKPQARQTDDRAIRAAILSALEAAPWAPMTTLNVTVANGAVDVWGTITNPDERRAICVVAENVNGVKEVHDHLVYIEPYSGTVIESPDDHP
ncbi:MAG: CBS domain-containing protein [Acetobacteraceae bacterium]|nr:CBS domain-containing protein [Acetobacteraceae bacterium]